MVIRAGSHVSKDKREIMVEEVKRRLGLSAKNNRDSGQRGSDPSSGRERQGLGKKSATVTASLHGPRVGREFRESGKI